MDILDDLEAQRRLDAQGMLDSIRDLPRQCRAAWQEAQALELPAEYRDIDKIIVLGMGGSAIGGDLLRAILARQSQVSVFNRRGYDLPPFVDERTLIIASSYTGNTEETLSAFGQGLRTAAKKLVITGGGKLLAMARANGVPAFSYQYRSEPRAALGYSLMPLIATAQKLGVMTDTDAEVEEAIAAMEEVQSHIDAEVPTESNPAKQLAQRLAGKLPVVYGANELTEVAHRWKTQLCENAKVWSFYEELPEANHNSLMGYRMPPEVAQRVFVVMLRSQAVHPRTLLRYEFTQQALTEAGVEHETVEACGSGALAHMMTLILFGDYASYYLAILNGVAPAPTPDIDKLKAWLKDKE